MPEQVFVDAVCIRKTTLDLDFFEPRSQPYVLDYFEAERAGILKHFRIISEVPEKQIEERYHDEVRPQQVARERERAEQNEEAEAKMREQKAPATKSYPSKAGSTKKGAGSTKK